MQRLVNQLARLNLRNLSPMQVNQVKRRKRTLKVRRSPNKLFINKFARLNLRNLSPMQVNQTKKRKRSPAFLSSPGKSVKKTKRGVGRK